MKTSLLSFIANETFISRVMLLYLWEQRDLWRPHDQIVRHQLIRTALSSEQKKENSAESYVTQLSVTRLFVNCTQYNRNNHLQAA